MNRAPVFSPSERPPSSRASTNGALSSFRDTVLSGRPSFGSRRTLTGRSSTVELAGGAVSADRPQIVLSPKPRSSHVGGRDHMGIEDGALVAHRDKSERPHTVLDYRNAISPGGRPLIKRMPEAIASQAHILFDGGNVVYTCGTTEAQMRGALDAGARKRTEAATAAGGRRVDSRRPTGSLPANVGGPDSVSQHFNHERSTYTEGVIQAQGNAVFDPTARHDAAHAYIAGARIESRWLGNSARRVAPPGGADSLSLHWLSDGAPAHPSESHAPVSPGRESRSRNHRLVSEVGGRSAPYFTAPGDRVSESPAVGTSVPVVECTPSTPSRVAHATHAANGARTNGRGGVASLFTDFSNAGTPTTTAGAPGGGRFASGAGGGGNVGGLSSPTRVSTMGDATPRSRLVRAQPVGGRCAGLSGEGGSYGPMDTVGIIRPSTASTALW